MVVVSNTSPLSNLAIVGRLALLRDQFGAALVPSAVQRELIQRRGMAGRLSRSSFALNLDVEVGLDFPSVPLLII